MDDKTEQPMPALRDLIDRKRVGMLTTIKQTLNSRPITTLEIEGADTVWFMTAADGSIAREVNADARVCVSYMADDDYVSLRGMANVVTDRSRIQALWNPAYSVWFEGPDDPNIALLRVVVEEVELWDTPSTTVGRLFALAKAVATGDSAALGMHARGAPAA